MGSSTTPSSAIRGPPSAASLPSSLGGSAGPSPMSMGFPSPASKPILSAGGGASTPDGVVSFSLGQDIGDDLPSTTPTHRKSTRVSFAARRDSDFLPSDLNGGDDVQGGPSTLVCPALHMLTEFVTPGEGWKCNLCTNVVGNGHTMHSCRQCNYDVCQPCYDKGTQARAARRDSSSSEEEEVAPLPSVPSKSRNSFVDEEPDSVRLDETADGASVLVLRTKGRRWRLMSQITREFADCELEHDDCNLETHGGLTEVSWVLKDKATAGALSLSMKDKLMSTVQLNVERARQEEVVKKIDNKKAQLTVINGIPKSMPLDRRSQRVLVVGPGFGQKLNPRQGAMIENAGFQVMWVHGLPNPEEPGVQIMNHVGIVKKAVDEFRPHVVAAASKGGVYLSALWVRGWWSGPALLINAHPSVKSLPQKTTIVLSHGSNDEVYPTPRAELERIISTGSPNRCFLHYTSNSGLINGTHYSRHGDQHNQESLLSYDCLPRLVDSALAPDGFPEIAMMRSWNTFLTQERQEVEKRLGLTPDVWRRFWTSSNRRGLDAEMCKAVTPGTEEHSMVVRLFKAQPTQPRAYTDQNPQVWQYVQILRIDRVENGHQMEGCALPYFGQLRRTIEAQGLTFEPGLHTRWLFHGSTAIESIVTNPVLGFQPLTSGARSSSVWGPGTYFARDAKYVNDGGFANIYADGTRTMLACLGFTGMCCLGNSDNLGVTPIRQGTHHYNSTVDCINNPEIFITQVSGAAYPAYIITYRPIG